MAESCKKAAVRPKPLSILRSMEEKYTAAMKKLQFGECCITLPCAMIKSYGFLTLSREHMMRCGAFWVYVFHCLGIELKTFELFLSFSNKSCPSICPHFSAFVPHCTITYSYERSLVPLLIFFSFKSTKYLKQHHRDQAKKDGFCYLCAGAIAFCAVILRLSLLWLMTKGLFCQNWFSQTSDDWGYLYRHDCKQVYTALHRIPFSGYNVFGVTFQSNFSVMTANCVCVFALLHRHVWDGVWRRGF